MVGQAKTCFTTRSDSATLTEPLMGGPGLDRELDMQVANQDARRTRPWRGRGVEHRRRWLDQKGGRLRNRQGIIGCSCVSLLQAPDPAWIGVACSSPEPEPRPVGDQT